MVELCHDADVPVHEAPVRSDSEEKIQQGTLHADNGRAFAGYKLMPKVVALQP
jgi:hypothetical protein